MCATLERNYYWPQLIKDVHKFCRTCNTCQRTKSSTQRLAGKMKPIPIPSKPYEEVTMDFMKMNKTARGNDIIFVVVDRFTKHG